MELITVVIGIRLLIDVTQQLKIPIEKRFIWTYVCSTLDKI